ncbi:hypothetical protein EDEG_02344 [Edhazardia aedis USNM 41457]|uniref:Uncharacterized protein n=1 Tax=Edhazardia aedis (strain USNM 41457) TaxID=1003232 RepID=J9D6Z4_EDHAE|nr:hypothetical protein EDEG_02344 [Edhazardia aedis USNM 41457]|eukprot:EJW03299.1 hypothetical protein EDEG_02344 [Edhazardia aedis USNM 41457]
MKIKIRLKIWKIFAKNLILAIFFSKESKKNTFFLNPTSEIIKKGSIISHFKNKEGEGLEKLGSKVIDESKDFSKFLLDTEFDCLYFDEQMKNDYKLHYPIGDTIELQEVDIEFEKTSENDDTNADEKIISLNQEPNFDFSFNLLHSDHSGNQNTHKIEISNLDKNPFKNLLTDYNLDFIFQDDSIENLENDNKISNINHLSTSDTKNSSFNSSNDVKDFRITPTSSSSNFLNSTHFHEVEPISIFEENLFENDCKKQIQSSNTKIEHKIERCHIKNKNLAISNPYSILKTSNDINSTHANASCNSNAAISELNVSTDSYVANNIFCNYSKNYKDSIQQENLEIQQDTFFLNSSTSFLNINIPSKVNKSGDSTEDINVIFQKVTDSSTSFNIYKPLKVLGKLDIEKTDNKSNKKTTDNVQKVTITSPSNGQIQISTSNAQNNRLSERKRSSSDSNSIEKIPILNKRASNTNKKHKEYIKARKKLKPRKFKAKFNDNRCKKNTQEASLAFKEDENCAETIIKNYFLKFFDIDPGFDSLEFMLEQKIVNTILLIYTNKCMLISKFKNIKKIFSNREYSEKEKKELLIKAFFDLFFESDKNGNVWCRREFMLLCCLRHDFSNVLELLHSMYIQVLQAGHNTTAFDENAIINVSSNNYDAFFPKLKILKNHKLQLRRIIKKFMTIFRAFLESYISALKGLYKLKRKRQKIKHILFYLLIEKRIPFFESESLLSFDELGDIICCIPFPDKYENNLLYYSEYNTEIKNIEKIYRLGNSSKNRFYSYCFSDTLNDITFKRCHLKLVNLTTKMTNIESNCTKTIIQKRKCRMYTSLHEKFINSIGIDQFVFSTFKQLRILLKNKIHHNIDLESLFSLIQKDIKFTNKTVRICCIFDGAENVEIPIKTFFNFLFFTRIYCCLVMYRLTKYKINF